MNLLRKSLFFLGLVFAAMALAGALLWVKNPNLIGNDIWRHAGKVLQGEADLLHNRTQGELIRYVMRRLEGHDKLQSLALPPLRWVQSIYERPVPPGPLPTLAKGQQATSLPPLAYSLTGEPLEAVLALSPPTGQAASMAMAMVPVSAPNQILVDSVDSLVKATEAAQPGQTIVIAPGRYTLNRRINTNTAGSASQPITVRAAQPGQVTLDFNTQVAFRVSKPHWVFENLHIRGICQHDSYCQHAFHIYGAAQSTVVRNNLIEDFNASFKINGANKSWPDFGLVQYNTLTNNHRRETNEPVTVIDLVGANRWRVSDNIISSFVKGQGNGISYGVFMKGASSGGRIERNLVICTPRDISQPGLRVGISFGGGTTGKPYCRDQRCDTEHKAGLAANNIVAHCNDFGIDVNLSSGILIAHNTLINTAGIGLREAKASARLYGNLLEGRIRQVNGAKAQSEMNSLVDMPGVFSDPDRLNLTWRTPPDNIPSLGPVPADFFLRPRPDGTPPGAFADIDLPLPK